MTEAGTGSSVLGTSRSLQILIVEDNPDGRETLRTLLEAWGYEVEVAADGWEGVQKALAGRPQVALLDIGLPRLDGFQVAEQLRAAFGRRIFLIACTAYSQLEYRQRSLQAGFDAYLVKPIDLHELARWLALAERMQL